ncbi:MAG: hypothetical protein J7539_07735 [Niabella sp.]|nr:hypothetical protein [Niabella sp.]
MSIYSKLLALALLTVVSISQVNAQDDKKTTVTVGVNYQNNLQYLGRVDSVKTPLIVPNVRLSLKNGLYAEADGYFGLNSGKLDGGYIAAGYELSKDKWGMGIGLSKYIFNASSDIVKSDISTSLEAYFYRDFKVVTFNVEPSYNFGSAGDFVLGTGLSKDIELGDSKGKFLLTPKLYLWLGSQNFVEQHYIRKGKGKGKGNGGTTVASSDVNKFNLMSVEASLPFSYTINKKFKLLAEPLLAFPQNYKVLGGYYASSAYPNPIFIMKVGVAYIF